MDPSVMCIQCEVQKDRQQAAAAQRDEPPLPGATGRQLPQSRQPRTDHSLTLTRTGRIVAPTNERRSGSERGPTTKMQAT